MDWSAADDEIPVERVIETLPKHSSVENIQIYKTNKGRYHLMCWAGYDGFVQYYGEHDEIWEEYHRLLSEG